MFFLLFSLTSVSVLCHLLLLSVNSFPLFIVTSNRYIWKWSCSVQSESLWPHGLQPTRLLRLWDFPGKSTGVGCHCVLCVGCIDIYNCYIFLLDWFFDHCIVSFLISCNVLYFKVSCLIWGFLLQLSFASHLQGLYFSILSLSVYMFLEVWSGFPVDIIYMGLVLESIQPVFVFWLGHSTHLHLR